jgi:hypothetical protein
MKIDFRNIGNDIKSLLKEHKYLPTILAVSVTATIVVGTVLYFRRKQRIVRYAKKFIGEEEISGNMGFVNDDFQSMMEKYGDFREGNQWCMSFAKMIWMQKFGKKYKDDLDNLMTPSTQTTWQNFANDTSGKFKESDKPSKGAIVIWQYYNNGVAEWKGHAGIVQNFTDKDFDTIEGNTNAEGGREGIEVAQKTRPYNWDVTQGLRLKGFISIA